VNHAVMARVDLGVLFRRKVASAFEIGQRIHVEPMAVDIPDPDIMSVIDYAVN
jgi:hypothetical protein